MPEFFSPYPPEDLGVFWEQIASEAQSVRLEYRRSPSELTFPVPHQIDRIEFRSVGGATVQGWLAYPEGARRELGFLWVPPYGRESLLPNAYGTREGMVSMSLNLHGLDAFHQEKYQPSRGYFSEGAIEPDTWIFRTLIQHVLVALRVFQAQPEVDEDRIGCMGMSQGAGLSLWAGGASNIVKAVCADMPFLGEMRWVLTRNAYRYPLKELTDFMESQPLGSERVMHTLSYYDTLNVATRCHKPTLVSLGEKDPACRPESVEAIFNAIPGSKKLVRYPGGHDWHTEMVEENAAWLRVQLG